MPFDQVCAGVQVLAADVHKISVSGRSVSNEYIRSHTLLTRLLHTARDQQFGFATDVICHTFNDLRGKKTDFIVSMNSL